MRSPGSRRAPPAQHLSSHFASEHPPASILLRSRRVAKSEHGDRTDRPAAATERNAGTSANGRAAGPVGVMLGGGAIRHVERGTTTFHLALLDLDALGHAPIDEHDDRSRV